MGTYKVIGLMSGSSLDGLDIAYCQIEEKNGKWTYQFLETACVEYDPKWKLRLANLALQNAITYLKTSAFFGHYVGSMINEFIEEKKIKPDFIASHGHTIFHQPDNHVSHQVGDGAAIASVTGLPVISDFRNCDVTNNGQGAPIVPIGDKYFFGDFEYCLNLGGIANISTDMEGKGMIGFDICPLNIVINKLSEKLGFDKDEDGINAKEGNVNEALLDLFNGIWYYDKSYPKTLSIGWVNKVISPIFQRTQIDVQDQLRTFYEHVAIQIAMAVDNIIEEGKKKGKVLVTGGGTHNIFLMECIESKLNLEIVKPDAQLIDYKEALIMAFMGVLRIRGEVNCLSSVTGADSDTIGGAIHQGANSKLPEV